MQLHITEKTETSNQHKSKGCSVTELQLLNKKYLLCVSMVGFLLFMSTVSPVVFSGRAETLQMHFAVHATVRAQAAAASMLNTQFFLSLSSLSLPLSLSLSLSYSLSLSLN